MSYCLRFEITTGINGATPYTATRLVQSIAEGIDGFAITTTYGEGYCEPWGGEPVLTIVHYGTCRPDAKNFAELVRVAFNQDSVTFGTAEASFTMLPERP